MNLIRPFLILIGFIVTWQIVIILTGVKFYILPPPFRVLSTLVEKLDIILFHASVTTGEIVLGLIFGILLGTFSALTMAYFRTARQWMMPLLIISQALPVFALAPILVLWLGFGIWSKVTMATLIIYFPVTAAFFDGLRRTEVGYLELARTMEPSRWSTLIYIRLPASMPSFATGVKMGAAVAPIGAIVGEWVGSSHGLGYLMLHANARMQIDVMFASLIVLGLIAVTIYFTVDALLRHLIKWQPDTQPSND